MQANSEPARLPWKCAMTADLLAMPAMPPEWRHSGPYLVIALALHTLVMLLAPSFLPEEPAIPLAQPITVTFEQPATLSVPFVPPPPPATAAPKVPPVPDRPRQSPVPRRAILAVVAQPGAKPAPFTVAESAVAAADERPGAAPPAAAGNAPVPVAAARFDVAYLHNPRPAYPPLSRRLGEEGRVLLRVRVGADGHPLAVDVDRSSSFERLDEAARRAVGNWRFVPARRGDEPVEGSVRVPVVFRLDD
jgi:protein TonB